ncbi:GumC domain-containing protein [Flaviaesturariibacter terrae]
MPDFLTLFRRWWKLIAGLVLLVAIVSAGILLTLERQYMGMVVALPGTSINFDKSKIFSENIQGLYPSLGGPDDIDRILGTAALDTLFFQLIRENDLVNHYRLSKSKLPLYQAMKELRENVDVSKDEYNQLRIRVFDRDKYLAARMANSLFDKFQKMHQRLQSASNERILANLQQHYDALQAEYLKGSDSLQRTGDARRQLLQVRNDAIIKELGEYQRLINEYTLVVNTKPSVLLLVEAARPGFKPERPKLLPLFAMATFVALVFAIVLVLFLESRKKA